MSHPTLPDSPPAEVAESSFLAVWRHRGWVEADPPAVEDDTPEIPARKGRTTNTQLPAERGAGDPDKEQ